MSSYLQLLIFGALAAAGNLLGGFLITRTSRSIINRLKYLIALGAGFMMAAVFIEVMPEVAEQWSGNLTTAMGWLLGGYLLIQLAEHTIAPHFHFGEETHREELIQGNAATTAVLALSVHTFFDGVAIASGMMTSFKLGLTLFIAILLHKIPEGFTMASIMLTSGKGLTGARKATIAIAVCTFLGIISVTLIKPAVIYTLPLSAGVTLYIAASDLIPQVNHEGGARTSIIVFLGVALFYVTHLLLHSALPQ